MSYLEFHLTFNLPAIALLAWLARGRLARAHLATIAIVCVIAVGFTFPWDSWAVRQGIWGFGDGKVLARIGNLPIEEVAFFILEVLVVSLLVILVLPKRAESSNA